MQYSNMWEKKNEDKNNKDAYLTCILQRVYSKSKWYMV